MGELKSVYRGHEIAGHTAHHTDLTKLDINHIKREVFEDKLRLLLYGGTRIEGLAYPYGHYKKDNESIINKAHIQYARVTECVDTFEVPDNFLCWKPTVYHLDDKLMDITERFLNSNAEGILLHLWGHSCELYEEDKWGVFEDWLKYITGYDNIWYATNNEICRYVTDYRKNN